MLCQKCHTATNAGDVACNTCGVRLKKPGRTRVKVMRVAIVMLILVAFGAYFVLQHFDIIDFDPFESLFGSGTTIAAEEPPPAVSTDSEDAIFANIGNNEAEPTVRRRNDEEHQAMLATYLTAVTAFINMHGHANILLSRAGFLYNATTSEFVSTSHLINLGFLDEIFENEDVLVLYLRPRDLAHFDETELPPLSSANSDDLTVFLAYQTPIGLGLYSIHGSTVIFRESLNEVLTYYSPDNGEIFRPTMADAIYHLVLEMIVESRPALEQEQIFIRHLAADDAHGFVAFSTSVDTNTIANIIFSIDLGLNLDEEYYTVLNIITAAAFEVTRMPTMVINSVVPNFNFDLLPLYDITPAGINFMDTDDPMFAALLAVLGDNSILVSVSYPFAYVVTADGQALLGVYNDGWVVEGVATWRAAEEIIAEHDGPRPFYILWQQ